MWRWWARWGGGAERGEVAMELDPFEIEGVSLLSWRKVLLIGRIFGTLSCQKAKTIAANVDARTGCPEIAYDSAVVEKTLRKRHLCVAYDLAVNHCQRSTPILAFGCKRHRHSYGRLYCPLRSILQLLMMNLILLPHQCRPRLPRLHHRPCRRPHPVYPRHLPCHPNPSCPKQ